MKVYPTKSNTHDEATKDALFQVEAFYEDGKECEQWQALTSD